MTYRRRIVWSAVAALALHVMFLIWAAWAVTWTPALPGRMVREEPLVLNLKPPQPPKRLIDTQVASEEPIDPRTDLISDKNSKASDRSGIEGERPAPHMDKESGFDELGGVAAPPTPPVPVVKPAPPAPAPGPPAPKPAPEKQASPSKSTVVAKEPAPKPAAQDESQAERFDVARAEPTPPEAAPSLPPAPAKRTATLEGRPQGGVSDRGFVGFEAYKDELAPYLKNIRSRVEGQWKAALQLRYSGTEPTEAVLNCAISPDGRLVSVDIIEPGNSPTYAALCKMAMERAAPFGPFPFKVPEIYRSQNLEIHWTFSFFK